MAGTKESDVVHEQGCSDQFVIAVRRGHRHAVDPDWPDHLVAVEGIEIIGTASEVRVQVEATEEAIAEVRRLLGDRFHIEPVISRHPLDHD